MLQNRYITQIALPTTNYIVDLRVELKGSEVLVQTLSGFGLIAVVVVVAAAANRVLAERMGCSKCWSHERQTLHDQFEAPCDYPIHLAPLAPTAINDRSTHLNLRITVEPLLAQHGDERSEGGCSQT